VRSSSLRSGTSTLQASCRRRRIIAEPAMPVWPATKTRFPAKQVVVEPPWLVIIMPLCFRRANTLDDETPISRQLNEASFEHAIYDPLRLCLQPGFHRFLVPFSLMRDLLFQKTPEDL